MTKKKKITIIAICCAIILIGSAIGIIIATWKRFDIRPNYTITYNNHTSLKTAKLPDGYKEIGSEYYTNATTLVENNNTVAIERYGVYSYIENDIIIPAKYKNGNIEAMSITSTDGTEIESIFRGVINDSNKKDIAYYNSKGSRLSITEYNETDKQLYGHIKEKDLSVSLKKKGVKIKTSDNFKDTKIAIKDASFKTAYYKDGVYQYEIWEIVDMDGNTYNNLYKVCNGKRQLVQTLNSSEGSNIESTTSNSDISQLEWLNETAREWVDGLFEYEELPLYFLKDGTPMLMQINIANVNEKEELLTLSINIYDIHFNLEDSTLITISKDFYSALRIGNNIFIQYTVPASDKKYSFATIENDTTLYFKLETYKLSLKSGSYSSISFNYLITDYNNSFNIETALIHAKEINNKMLQKETLMLANEKLQTKEITYEFNYLTKINDERYIAHGDNGDYLIDEKYNQLCYLGRADSFFTTKDALLLSYTEENGTAHPYTYVCDMNGTIIKKYDSEDIENINNDTYYVVKTEREIDGNTYEEKYLERLGVRESTPIHSSIPGQNKYTFNGKEYIKYYDEVYSSNDSSNKATSLITRVSEKDDRYLYSFYTINNKLLANVELQENNCKLVVLWEGNDYMLVRITNRGNTEYTMLLDK